MAKTSTNSIPPLPVEHLPLFPPPLPSIAAALNTHLPNNYISATCTISTPPDLRQPPYHLAAAGLSGSPRIIDVGHASNLMPPNLTKRYELLDIARLSKLPEERGFLLGAAFGPHWVIGTNAELTPNVAYERTVKPDGQLTTQVHNETYSTRVHADTGQAQCQRIASLSGPDLTGFAVIANLYGCEGLPGDVLHVKAVGRKGDLNFIAAIQDAVQKHFIGANGNAKDGADANILISLGGIFLIKRGKAKLHVMPDFPADRESLRTLEDVTAWLKYFESEAPLVCCSVLHVGDQQGMELMPQHTHCFSVKTGEDDVGSTRGGHYHYDLDETRDVVEYEGWFNVAEELWRIDRPGASVG